jgi:hypothetical protein
MRMPALGPDEISDPDIREIEFKKNNYGPKDAPVKIRWSDGIYTVSEANDPAANFVRAQAEKCDDDLFLKLLTRLIDQGRNVSHSRTATNGAPAVMATEPECIGKVNKRRLTLAMQRLFGAKKIKLEPYGRPSRPQHRIVPNEERAA